jgi:hypothetical protein
MKRKLLAVNISAALAVLSVSVWAQNATPSSADAVVNFETNLSEPVEEVARRAPVPVSGTVSGNVAADAGSTRTNDVQESYNGAGGIAHVQQNNGSNNEINAATVVHTDIAGDHDIGMGAFVNSQTTNNSSFDGGSTRDNLVSESFNGFGGVAVVQQNNGDHNAIGAATVVHTGTGAAGNVAQGVFVLGSTASQTGPALEGPIAVLLEAALQDQGSQRRNTVNPSFNDASGVFTVQQNNGNANAISAATAVAGNLGAGNVLQQVLVSGTVNGNAVVDFGATRTNSILDSFNNAAGVATVQQNNGDANVLGIGTAVAANIGNANAPADPSNVEQSVAAGAIGAVTNNVSLDLGGERQNIIGWAGAFNGFRGVASVQQNNGSNNLLSLATAVKADIGTTGVVDFDFETATQTALALNGSVANGTVHAAGANEVDRKNVIFGSFNDSAGVVSVQQNNGDGNALGIANAVTLNLDSHESVDFVGPQGAGILGAVTDSIAFDVESVRYNKVESSFGGARGLIGVQQNNGSNNVIHGANAVVANVTTGDPVANTATNSAVALAGVTGNQTVVFSAYRKNAVRESFNGASGVSTTQQNNGDHNVMNAANAVTVNVGGPGFDTAVSAAALGSVVSGNLTVVDAGTTTYNTVSNSYNGASGIHVVQQNNGNGNAIQSAIAVVANYP